MPDYWTPDHVAVRLVEAFRTLDAQPGRDGHRLIRSLLGDMVAPQPDRRIKPTPRQVSDMEAALQWSADYLWKFEALSQITQRCALLRSRGLEMDVVAELMDLSVDDVAEKFEAGTAIIAHGLRQRDVPVS